MARAIPIQVECYAGYRSEESPRSFSLDGRRYEIEEIVDRWYQGSRDPAVPACDYFKVRAAGGILAATEGGILFILRMDRESFSWYLMEAGS
jgi:hypothetical protein